MVTRRRFIQAGLAGTALLVTVRWLDARAATPGLDEKSAEIIRALIPVVLEGSLPTEPAARAKAVEETVEAYARVVSGLSPAIQEEVAEMFSVLSFAPTRMALAGIGSSWREASAQDIAAFLHEWRASRLELKRAGYRALTQLIQGAWFDNPLAWPIIGYPGPPALSPPA